MEPNCILSWQAIYNHPFLPLETQVLRRNRSKDTFFAAALHKISVYMDPRLTKQCKKNHLPVSGGIFHARLKVYVRIALMGFEICWFINILLFLSLFWCFVYLSAEIPAIFSTLPDNQFLTTTLHPQQVFTTHPFQHLTNIQHTHIFPPLLSLSHFLTNWLPYPNASVYILTLIGFSTIIKTLPFRSHLSPYLHLLLTSCYYRSTTASTYLIRHRRAPRLSS